MRLNSSTGWPCAEHFVGRVHGGLAHEAGTVEALALGREVDQVALFFAQANLVLDPPGLEGG
jgi:hypothetical protein